MTFYGILKLKVRKWRKNKYQSNFPIISEILEFNRDLETGKLRFLRKAQLKPLKYTGI